MAKKLVILNFSRELLKEPIIHNLGQQFCLVTNIHLAEITEDMGWLKVELEGEARQIEDGLAWMMSRGVRVESITEC
ncbi:MAG: NIL domain-containing protein [Dehalococcoidales bacterium]|nr:NIL domain-containing protein [Dehalococcoidales bacterium]